MSGVCVWVGVFFFTLLRKRLNGFTEKWLEKWPKTFHGIITTKQMQWMISKKKKGAIIKPKEVRFVQVSITSLYQIA